ncbi:MAG: type II toxin-antitoxin system VapC family toxin [Pyrinomonadaceae bacterium]
MIFVDTGGWFGSIVPTDENHEKARNWFLQNREPLITSNYVVDETLTLFKVRGEYKRALQIGEQFFNGSLTGVYDLSSEDIIESWKVFKKYADKEWSFTDCSSKVVMKKLGINRAFAFDIHFRQFGNIVVLP